VPVPHAAERTHGLRGQTFSISPLSHPSSRPSVPSRLVWARDDDSLGPPDLQIKGHATIRALLSHTRKKTSPAAQTQVTPTTLLPVEQRPNCPATTTTTTTVMSAYARTPESHAAWQQLKHNVAHRPDEEQRARRQRGTQELHRLLARKYLSISIFFPRPPTRIHKYIPFLIYIFPSLPLTHTDF
jgi:hypothetical protein